MRDANATWNGFSDSWTSPCIDLTSYADSTVRIAFRFNSTRCFGCGATEDLGWYLDDMTVTRSTASSPGPALLESFEGGPGNWCTTAGQWEIGNPTSGPPSGHTGAACAGTRLAGNYVNGLDSRLVSPPFDLPALPACETLRLRFWHWIRIHGDDAGTIEVSTRGPAGWGPFLAARGTYPVVVGFAPMWSHMSVDLSSYADSTVRVAFRFVTSRCFGCGATEDAGWYIDDVEVVKGVEWNPAGVPGWETFVAGQGDWSVEGGQWEVGRPVGTPAAASDSLCAGTILDGNYFNGLESRLISPPMRLGNSILDLKFCFDSWYRIAGDDVAKVQVSQWTGGVWGNWNDISPNFVGDSGGWTPFCIDDALAPYAGSTVRFAFYFATARCFGCGATEDLGWYVDNVQTRGLLPSDAVPAVAPVRVALHQNIPNPFNPATVITFALSAPEAVELAVLDAAGRHVRTLVRESRAPGAYHEAWDGRDDRGHAVASGVYLYRLRTASGDIGRRMVLVR